ncbi:hypothetical protein F66182_6940 [Fusarium sp. NRRL 66182]|nr:hypothetical protein F66182_6940 [Fusarium sp. NRRL 66182]
MTIFSTPVSPELLRRSGTTTRFPTVIHQKSQICTVAAEGLLQDFNEAMATEVTPLTIAHVPELGRVHAIALTIPNCIPERLAVLTRFAEFTILNDDFYDIANADEIGSVNNDIQNVLAGKSQGSLKSLRSSTKSKQFQSRIVLDMLDIDQELASDILTTYSSGLALATLPPDSYKSLDEYLPPRLINSGLDWPKEVKHHIEHPGSEYPFNGVAILMRHQGCTEKEAMQKLRDKQIECQERHLELLRKLESEHAGRVPEDWRLYILAAQYAASGSEFWSIHVPRYPSKEDLQQPEIELVGGRFCYATQPSEGYIAGTTCPLPTIKMKSVTTAGGANGKLNGHHVNGRVSGLDNHSASNGSLAKRARDDDSPVMTGDSSLKRKRAHVADQESFTAHCPVDFVLHPYQYLASMPSKGIRDTFIQALNWWLDVPERSLVSIKSIIGMLHQSSLMLDDIEDGSPLRRGSPSTHMVYGTAQTINSANYIFVQAFAELRNLTNLASLNIFIEEVENLHKGQAADLSWKFHVTFPTVDEYMAMIDDKTGGLFRLCVRLMQAESTRDTSTIDPARFVSLLSRYFQIRDDYQNLTSQQYAKEKGFAEDLDEGKISLPLIYCLQKSRGTRAFSEIIGIFKQRDHEKPLQPEMKRFIIDRMNEVDALTSTYSLLQSLQDDLLQELRRQEKEFGSANPTMELVLRKLWI